MSMLGWWSWLLLLASLNITSAGILFPRASESREVTSLDGIWMFATSPTNDPDAGFSEKWYQNELEEWTYMPVPASYNDVTTDAKVRDFIGWVWYQRSFFAPRRWKAEQQRVFLRFGSVHYTAVVWVNGKVATDHSGGHLPFEGEITQLLHYGRANLVTVAVNNTLTQHTIPQGSVYRPNDTTRYPEGYIVNAYTFDFYNYAGIHRPVYLYTTPQIYIDDVTVRTDIHETTGVVGYTVTYVSTENSIPMSANCEVSLLDANSVTVASQGGCKGELKVDHANLWWPIYMHPKPGYLYTLEVHLVADGLEDIYRLPVGIRSLSWNNATGLEVNGKRIYFRGFGKHEDSNTRGKGLDYPILLRDHNLIQWIGANSYRTSHYPYAEEAMDLADRIGIMIIDECPAVNLDNFDEELLTAHKNVLQELYQRDKNRPSVVMWSVANEPRSQRNASGPYFKAVAEHVRRLDPTRPVTFVANVQYDLDKGGEHMDVIGFNHYSAWYSDAGHIDLIQYQVLEQFEAWHKRYNKPMFMSEYGAGSMVGLHALPISIWTEDYQMAVIQQHFESFDKLRKKGFFIGEMVWNFADFATKQDYNRVLGNRKGLFTRERQPKMAAYILRSRYRHLAEVMDKHTWTNQ